METLDGDAVPFARDPDLTWHKRPAGDPFIRSAEGPNCRTRCGQAIRSDRVSRTLPVIVPPELLCSCVTADQAVAGDQ